MSVVTFDGIINMLVVAVLLAVIITMTVLIARRVTAHTRLDSEHYSELAKLARRQAEVLDEIEALPASYNMFPPDLWRRLIDIRDQSRQIAVAERKHK